MICMTACLQYQFQPGKAHEEYFIYPGTFAQGHNNQNVFTDLGIHRLIAIQKMNIHLIIHFFPTG